MMSKIDVLIVPSLRSSAVKASRILADSGYDVIFLNLPTNLQSLISEYTSGSISLQELISRIGSMRLIPEPISSWLYLNEPLLRILRRASKPIKAYCYVDVDYYHMLIEAAVRIARLTYKANVTGRIDVNEWIRVIEGHIRSETMGQEAEFISLKARGYSICITGLSGWKIARILRGFGHEVKVKSAERLYMFRPLEILETLMETGNLTHRVAEELIREHVRFVRDYVLTSESLDKAYYSWINARKRLVDLLCQINQSERPINSSISRCY